jgi:AcrR family transcriptional regulator
MADSCSKSVDPRVRRTRQLLQQALENLLNTKGFEEISVQDIADAATVNRATFYDHYGDKFALLECMVATRFNELLVGRGVKFDGTCSSAVRAIVLGVCDFLAGTPSAGCGGERRIEGPRLESAVIAVVRHMILDGLRNHPSGGSLTPEMIATTASWAIYGGAKEWLQTPNREPSEEAADAILGLVLPMLHPADALSTRAPGAGMA